MKTLIQCDFDGTITVEDVSFLLLNAFADGDWTKVWQDYIQGKMTVGAFNAKAFAMVKADKRVLVDFILKNCRMILRPGFKELLDYCSREGLRFVIVSNGLSFYIETILKDMGINGIEVFAAQSQFLPQGVAVSYIGPDGNRIEVGFKEAYTEWFQKSGYKIVYVGNGPSDIFPSKRADYVFAIDDLLKGCREANIECIPFDDFHDVVRGLDALSLG